MRLISTVVFPLPAPARISSGPPIEKDSLPLPVVHAGEPSFEHRAAKRENFRFIHKVKTAFCFVRFLFYNNPP